MPSEKIAFSFVVKVQLMLPLDDPLPEELTFLWGNNLKSLKCIKTPLFGMLLGQKWLLLFELIENQLSLASKVLLINVPNGGLLPVETTDSLFCSVVGKI